MEMVSKIFYEAEYRPITQQYIQDHITSHGWDILNPKKYQLYFCKSKIIFYRGFSALLLTQKEPQSDRTEFQQFYDLDSSQYLKQEKFFQHQEVLLSIELGFLNCQYSVIYDLSFYIQKQHWMCTIRAYKDND